MAETAKDNNVIEEVQASHNFLNEVLGNIGCLVRVINPKTHKVIFQNKPLHSLYPNGLERPCYTFWGTETKCELCTSTKAIEENGYFSKEVETPGGILYEVHSFPLSDTDGTITNAIEVIRDVTAHRKTELELKESRKQLLESQKMAMTTVGSLANGIAHHLNNPLSGIDMCADILLKKIEEVKEATLYGELKYSITRIKEASRRCETAMGGLLSVSRISAPDRLPISMIKLTEHVLREASIQLERAGIQLARELLPADIRVFGGHSQLRMAFANIISVAVDAMSNGGVLTFKTMHLSGEGKVEVTISDTGPEIKESDLPHLFDPYFILKIRPAGRCTGLELALAQFTFQLHGGTIEADSGVGKGTTFKVKLPVYNETLQPNRESIPSSASGGLRAGLDGAKPLQLNGLPSGR